jgi:2,4-dienoyl-CoA reductase-like NADH-dependent reductase (Old Yellow Enzyme family)
MQAALADGSCDLIGSARPAILSPSLPRNIILNEKVPDDEAKVATPPVKAPWLAKHLAVKAVSAGVESVSHLVQEEEFV